MLSIMRNKMPKINLTTSLSQIENMYKKVPFPKRVKPKIISAPQSTEYIFSNSLERDISEVQMPTITKLKKEIANLPNNLTNDEIKEIKKKFIITCRRTARKENSKQVYDDMIVFADKIFKMGNKAQKRVAKILYGEVIKIHTNSQNYKKLIDIIPTNIEQEKAFDDKVHVLGRLHTLTEAYKELGQKKNYYLTLKDARECVNEILANYERAKANYISISRPMPTKANFLQEKAHFNTCLAECLAHKKQNNAVKYIAETIHIYEELGMEKEAIFARKQLLRLKQSKMPNKLKIYKSNDMRKHLGDRLRRQDKSGETFKPTKTHYFTKKLILNEATEQITDISTA